MWKASPPEKFWPVLLLSLLCTGAGMHREPLEVDTRPALKTSSATTVSAANVEPKALVDVPALKVSSNVALTGYISAKFGRPFADILKIVDAAHLSAERHQLPPNLVLAVIAAESEFNARAVSSYGALGLMQVVPRFHLAKLPNRAASDLYTPAVNIEVGGQILEEYIDLHGTLQNALRKYSGDAGGYDGRINRYWREFDRVADVRI